MMEWRPFDIKSFLKASRHWKEDRRKLEQELKDLLYLPSINNESGVRSGNIAEPAAQIAMRRLKISEEIDKISRNEEMLDTALKSLTEDERVLVSGFYYPKTYIGVFVQEYGREHGLCKDYVYAERDRVLEKMRRVIEHNYYDF